MLALHTTELQENVPVIEVISFITDMLYMAGKIAFDFILSTHSFHWPLLNFDLRGLCSCKRWTLGPSVGYNSKTSFTWGWPLVGPPWAITQR